ncbi:mevalonate kinase-like [Nylanderia fulva]|uniref:mevalonate kinase-like n=1 Tax=Nylanderia fulva TaxID=613905 RepID=UPI0010FB05EF|nr:mevalonate kinase-like [Nylanderia fulva]
MIAKKFKISAPGSMILLGENRMMYDKHVVTASLDLRTTVEFCELSTSRKIIEIEFPDVNLSLNLSLDLVLNFFFADRHFYPMTDHILLLRHVQYFITSNGMWSTCEQKFSLQTFLFLLLYIAHNEEIDIIPFRVHLTTELPMKASLGSSTSFATCLAGCFLHWARLQKGAHYIFNEKELSDISRYVEYCEEVVQNYTFGVSHEVCTYGQIVTFQYDIQKGFNIRLLKVPKLNILLIDSKMRPNKYLQKEIMARVYSSGTDILDRLDLISRKVSYCLAQIDEIQRNNDLHKLKDIYEFLFFLILLDQFYLVKKIGLSHPNLNRIYSIAYIYGLAGKLTGCGEYVYILLTPAPKKGFIAKITEHLMKEGFPSIMITIYSATENRQNYMVWNCIK